MFDVLCVWLRHGGIQEQTRPHLNWLCSLSLRGGNLHRVQSSLGGIGSPPPWLAGKLGHSMLRGSGLRS